MFYGIHDNISELERHVQRAVEKLAPHLDRFDSIAVRGVSGLLVGSPVALKLRKPLVVVRKDTESTHSRSLVESLGALGPRALFLDDFVSTGDTRWKVEEAVTKKNAALVGQYTYQGFDVETNDYTGELRWYSEDPLPDAEPF